LLQQSFPWFFVWLLINSEKRNASLNGHYSGEYLSLLAQSSMPVHPAPAQISQVFERDASSSTSQRKLNLFLNGVLNHVFAKLPI
jgi:hypothetical protein